MLFEGHGPPVLDFIDMRIPKIPLPGNRVLTTHRPGRPLSDVPTVSQRLASYLPVKIRGPQERPQEPAPRADLPMKPGAHSNAAGETSPAGPSRAAGKPGGTLASSSLEASEQAPIHPLEGRDLQRAIERFETSLDGWKVKTAFSVKGLFMPNREAEAWNSRVKDIALALEHRQVHATNVAYMFGDQPVGLMSVSHPTDALSGQPAPYMEVHALVSHPGSAGVGGALMEHAVNMAQEAGLNGKIRLITLPGAKNAYKAMGFERLQFSTMELDPSKSDKWERAGDDGKWRLTAHADKTYITGPAGHGKGKDPATPA